MATSTKNIIIDDADKPNAGANAPRRYDTVTQRRPVNVQAWLAAALLAFVVLGCGGVAVWSFAAYKYQSDARFAALVDGSAFVLVAAVVATLGAVLWSVSAGAVRAARRTGLVEWPGGATVDARAVRTLQAPQLMQMYAAHMGVEGRYADNSQFQRVTNFSGQIGAPAKALPSGDTVDSPEVTVLPNVGPLPSSEWLAWLDEQPHAIFAAATGRGKSTIAKYGLSPRIIAGESIFVIDAHSNGWFDLPGVGGGENWQIIEAAMMAVYAEYKTRLQYRERHKRETGDELAQDYFPRLTVVFDEANNAQDAFARLYSGSRRRFDPWPLFAQCLGSGARKVGISVWLLLQSALVEDLGLSGSMRQNFTRIAMDAHTINQMAKEERDDGRRKAIYAALPSIEYPATAMIQSKVFLLDRTGLDNPPIPRNSSAAAWEGWDYQTDRPLVTLDDDAQPAEPPRLAQRAVAKAQASTVARASVAVPDAGAIVYPPAVKTTPAKIAWLLNTGYSYRQIERELSVSHATISQINKALQRSKDGAK